MTEKIDVLLMEPGKAPELVRAENTLEALEQVMLVCQENAKHGDHIAGKFLLCGLGEDGFASLTPAQQLEFQNKFLEGGCSDLTPRYLLRYLVVPP